LARRLVLDVGDDALPEVWALSTDLDPVPLVFRLNDRLGWSLGRSGDWVRDLSSGRFAHALFRFEDGPRSYALLWNAPHEASLTTPQPEAPGLFGELEADPSAQLFVRRPRGINAFLVFDPPLSSQEIVGLQRHLNDVPGLLGCNPRTSLTPNEHAQFVFEPLKDSDL